MSVVVIKDGKVLRTFKDGDTYAYDEYFPPGGSYIFWNGDWYLMKGKSHTLIHKVPNVIKTIALLAQ